MSKYIDADILGSLVDSHGNVHYEHIKSIPSMTLEELKAVAKKMGYEVIKRRRPIPKLTPCTCGCNRRTTSYGPNYIKLTCNKCGKAIAGKNRRDVTLNWNRMIEDEQNK